MAKRLVKNIPTGETVHDVISVRPQNQRVRLHDVSSGQIIFMTPDIARRVAEALKFAAKHAEITKPLAYQLYEAALERTKKNVLD